MGIAAETAFELPTEEVELELVNPALYEGAGVDPGEAWPWK